MPTFVYNLFHDLRQRCASLLNKAERLGSKAASDVQPYATNIAARLRRLDTLIELYLRDPDIKVSELASYYFGEYRNIARFLHETEFGPILALERFGNNDLFLSRLVAELCREIQFPYAPPLCVALAHNYYFTLPEFDLIFAPASEPSHLLALPDLLHELAHFVFIRSAAEFATPLKKIVAQRFKQLRQQAKQKNWAAALQKQLSNSQQLWEDHWLEEFGCDMLATYWGGPAFGWTNLRLCTNLGDAIFIGNPTHPADDARTQGINAVLREMGHSSKIAALESRWQEMVRLSRQSKANDFDLFYPPGLLDQIAASVCATAKANGMLPFHGEESATVPKIAGILNQAWAHFDSAPESFAAFEVGVIQDLRQRFNVAEC